MCSSEAKRKETGTMPFTLAYIGDRLKVLREEQYLSQRELAKAAGVSPTTIFKLEANQADPQPRTIRKLAKALGVSPVQLAPRD
jgi:transcriptional regulator with XRE-family HTH domain